MSYKTQMNGGGESYNGVILAKHPNKTGRPEAEGVEGRPLTKENAEQPNPYRTQGYPASGSGRAGQKGWIACGKQPRETGSYSSPLCCTM